MTTLCAVGGHDIFDHVCRKISLVYKIAESVIYIT